MGGSSPRFRPGKGVSVEKLGGRVSSLSLVMLEKVFFDSKRRWNGNYFKDKGPSMDEGPYMGNNGDASGSVTSNVEDGLSAIATKFGSPWMLYSYTAAMCIDSRAMIELKVKVDLRDTIGVVVPKYSCEEV
uniref:Uncharacterized protein n=1 Tax=Tanacetum cinerariifolium TaxID=118510 RepID=A0A6L2NW71_TANCI|nr:hypothetical protein [Tanacetum cinerariifolium]